MLTRSFKRPALVVVCALCCAWSGAVSLTRAEDAPETAAPELEIPADPPALASDPTGEPADVAENAASDASPDGDGTPDGDATATATATATTATTTATATATTDTDTDTTATTAVDATSLETVKAAPEATPEPAAKATATAVPPAAPAPAATTTASAPARGGKPQPGPAVGQPPAPKKPVLVPGTGPRVKGVGDDFEDEKWTWYYNHPKSSEEQDKRMRGPFGKSANRHWFEGPKRGTPDLVKRIELPSPGLEGSAHGLLISSLHAGIPGRITGQMQQDDLIYNMQRVTGQGISAADSPSVVVRVYLPPFEQWENRSGPSFGFRAGCYTHAIITGEDHPDRGRFGLEEYWPGMFICFESAHDGRFKQDGAFIRVRSGRNGAELRGPKIEELGWWTLGLSFSPDGMVHYFASPGVDDLTMDDHITSQFPYGYRTEWLKTFFFNVCTRDDGRTWSTPWVIDDPRVHFVKRPEMAKAKQPTKR